VLWGAWLQGLDECGLDAASGGQLLVDGPGTLRLLQAVLRELLQQLAFRRGAAHGWQQSTALSRAHSGLHQCEWVSAPVRQCGVELLLHPAGTVGPGPKVPGE